MNTKNKSFIVTGMGFIPMPVETLGGWHEQTVMQVKRLGSALARKRARPSGTETGCITWPNEMQH